MQGEAVKLSMDDGDGIQVMLFLVRHGETLANKAGILQGQSESPLSEKGERQAGEVGEALKNVPFWRGYSSDLGRAKNTARILLGRHHNGAALAEHALVLDPNLRECALGWKEMLPRGTGEAEGRRIAQEQGTEGRPMEDWPDVERRALLAGPDEDKREGGAPTKTRTSKLEKLPTILVVEDDKITQVAL